MRANDRRLFLPAKMGTGDFFAGLNAAGCRYALLLRSWKPLPAPDCTARDLNNPVDLDVLVHDEDVDLLVGFLQSKSLVQRLFKRPRIRCDVYSVSGLKNSTYRGVPYYPARLADHLLRSTVRHSSGAMVPDRENQFCSLAYHVLYHKGLAAGIPSSDQRFRPSTNPDHSYACALRELADRIGLCIDVNMQALDRELDRRGWQPSAEMLRSFLPNDAWAVHWVQLTERHVDHTRAPEFFELPAIPHPS